MSESGEMEASAVANDTGFAFLQLPKEMQSEVLGHVDLETCKNVALCSKAARTACLPVLFSSIQLPRKTGIGREPETFPIDACDHVKAFRFRLSVVYAAHITAQDVRREIAQQFGTLGSLGNLQEIHITVAIAASAVAGGLERSLSTLKANMSAIISQARSTATTLAITRGFGVSGSDDGILPILTQLLEPLAGIQVAKLKLRALLHRSSANTAFHGEPAYEAFKRLASCLRQLCLTGDCWFAWCNPFIPFPNLERFEISAAIYTRLSRQAFMGNLPNCINACMPSLKHLTLSLYANSVGDSEQAGTILDIPQLATLNLREQSMMAIRNLLSTLSCHTVVVDIQRSREWTVLFELLSSGRFPRLQRLELFWNADDDDREVDVGVYARIRDRALSNNINIDLHVEGAALCWDEAVLWLKAAQGDLVSFDCWIMPTGPERVSPGISYQEINLSKLQSLCIRIEEELDDTQYTASYAFYDILFRMRAPCLREIILDNASPVTEYLPTLCHALERDTFPMLRVISGRYAIQGCADAWESDLNSFRKERFLEECRSRSIDTADLSWEVRYRLW